MSRIYDDEPSNLWLQIATGIITAAVVIFLLLKGYVEYEEWKAEQSLKAMTEAMAEQNEKRRLKLAQQKMDQQIRREYFSPECKFWRAHYQKDRSERTREKIKEYCPNLSEARPVTLY